MERYDSYKDSGVQWLGEIPSHWEMKRWRFLMVENTKKNSDSRVRRQLQFRYGDIVRKANQSEESDVLDTISKYIVVEPNDIMINGLNLNYDFVSQRVAQVKEEGAITSAYISLRPTNIACSRYYTYFLKSMDSKKMFHGMGTGIRLTLSYNELKNHFIPRPSIEEQDAIANYLDNITSKIDEAIAQQQKMIDLLNERKQIIINNAVTKGLNPDAPMKDSGVEWIGMIPEKWEVSKLKLHSYKIGDGLHGTPIYSDSGSAYFINGNNLRNETILINDSTMKVNETEYRKYCIKLGGNALLISINGSIGYTSFYNGEKIVLSKSVGFIDLYTSICKRYIRYYLMSSLVLDFFYRHLTGSTIGNLSLETLRNTQFPIPPMQEQEEIAYFLDEKVSQVEMLIKKINEQIALLQERKQIIINDVVTGKVKVPN